VYGTGLHIYDILLDRWVSLCLLVVVRAEFYRFYFFPTDLS